MKKARSIVGVIVLGLLFVAGYAKFLNHTVGVAKQETYEFQVGNRVWDITGDCPAVVYRVNWGLPATELRYKIESSPRGSPVQRWVLESALDPLTNQTPRLAHER